MTSFLFHNLRFLDPRRDELLDGIEVLVEDGIVQEVADRPIASAAAQRIDLGRPHADARADRRHIHVVLTEVNIRAAVGRAADACCGARPRCSMRAMLMRGFTTLRDTGGADWGIKAAVEQGLFVGPRLFIAGAAAQPDRRPWRLPPAHRIRRIVLRLLLRAATGSAASPTACPR